MDRPKSIDHWSPNFTARDPGRTISCVVIHATAGAKEPSLDWLCNPQSKVSAHYLIDKLGAIYHLVHEQNVAWHAGESQWRGMEVEYDPGKFTMNPHSVGIELENANNGLDDWPTAQIKSCADLTAAICLEHGIKSSDVVGHKDIAPGRKTDPTNFDFDDFRTMLVCRGVER